MLKTIKELPALFFLNFSTLFENKVDTSFQVLEKIVKQNCQLIYVT